jgi:hypothetical protein
MRYLSALTIILLLHITTSAQERTSHFTSWNDFKASTVRSFRQGTNRVVLSEDAYVTDKYRQWTFDADAAHSGYYIIVLYNSRFCDPPTAYFNYGDNTGGDFTFHGNHDGEYCYHLLKVKSYPGKTGHVYIKSTGTKCESTSVKLYVI